jgi:hypothetical protein
MVYNIKIKFKFRVILGLLVGSMGIAPILPGCQRNRSQDSKTSAEVLIQAEQSAPNILPESSDYQVQTTKSDGLQSQSLIYGSSAPGGLKNATLKITMGSSLERFNDFQLSLSRPGEVEQKMSVSCRSKGCRLTANTISNPKLVKFALTHYLKKVISEVRGSTPNLSMTQTRGLNLLEMSHFDFQLLIVVCIMLILAFITTALIICQENARINNFNRVRIQNELEMMLRNANLSANATQTIVRRATVLVENPEGTFMVGRRDPELETLPPNPTNADIIQIYDAVVGER